MFPIAWNIWINLAEYSLSGSNSLCLGTRPCLCASLFTYGVLRELIFLRMSFNQMEDEFARRRQIILRTDWFQICFFPDDCVLQYPPFVLQSNSHSMGNIQKIFAEESIPKM